MKITISTILIGIWLLDLFIAFYFHIIHGIEPSNWNLMNFISLSVMLLYNKLEEKDD